MAKSKSSKSSTRRKGPKRIAVAIELDQPYLHHHDCYRGILRYADEQNWQCVVDPYIVGMTGQAGIKEYDGIVGRINSRVAAKARAACIPVVNHWLNSTARGLPGVFQDFHKAGRIAGVHLGGRGFHRFAYLGTARDRVGPLELAGYEQAIRDQGFRVTDKYRVPRNFEKQNNLFSKFRKDVNEWIASLTTPVGIFVPSDIVARYMVQICRELNLRVPHDIGIVSQYNTSTICMGTEPTLTSIEHDNERVGYCAAELLGKLMRRKRSKPPRPMLIAPKGLRARGSSDAFVSDDPMVSRAMRYIADHSRDAISVSEVADYVKTTTRTLARRFEQYVGQSIYTEISRLRAEYLKRILIDTETPLGNIAANCGFSSTSHFTLFFRKATGLSPGEFRKKHRA